MFSVFKQKTQQVEATTCPRCGSELEKRWYNKERFSFVCSNLRCGYVA